LIKGCDILRNESWDTEEGTYDKTYYLYEVGNTDGYIDSIIDTCLENARDYFIDNVEDGDFIIECPEDNIKISL